MTEKSLTPMNQNGTVAHDDTGLFSDARIQLIRDMVAKGAPEIFFAAMIDIARRRNLDPLAKQIGLMKFGSDWVIFTPIDGYRAIAADSDVFAGKDRPEFGPIIGETPKFGRGIPEWCSVTVYRMVQGQRVPFTAEVYWDEYNGETFTWNKMPRTMLAKVAESHALRMAFSRSLSGIYAAEEMDQAFVEVSGYVANASTGEVVTRNPTPIAATTQRLPANQEPSNDIEDRRKGISDRLHAKVSHDALHNWAVSKGVGSFADVTIADMAALANDLRTSAGIDPFVAAFGDKPKPIKTGPITDAEAEAIETTGTAQPELVTAAVGATQDRFRGDGAP